MRFLFLGGVYPPQLYNKILRESKRGFQFAADVLQNSLIEGISSHNRKLKVLTAPFISAFPFGSNFLFFKGFSYRHNLNTEGRCIGFINLPVIKDSVIARRLENELYKWSVIDKDERCIIVYSLQVSLIKAAIKAKIKDKSIIICIVIPDLPENMGYNKIYGLLGFKEKANRYIYANLKNFDCYVLLSKYMIEKLDLELDRFVIVEGVHSSVDFFIGDIADDNENIILYTGSLDKNYGIDNLLKAFESIKDKSYKLWICGDGPMKREIQLVQSYDERIIYYGVLPRNQILIMQKKATVLVNPRMPTGNYTFYSFPSKTMEYLASGTPTILYRLGGIPDEYYDYCFIPEDGSIDSLKKLIISVCEMNKEDRIDFGRKAVSYIRNYKNAAYQTQKIINLIDNVSK